MSEQNYQSYDATGAAGAPQMSTPETLANIFFEPGRTFEALRERPRFLAAALVIVALSLLLTFALFNKVNFTEFMRQQMEKNEQMTAEQVDRAVAFWNGPGGKVLTYAIPLVWVVVTFAAGAALYLLGSMLMGGALRYKQALAVWTYSSFPPAVLGTLVGIVLVLLKSADDLDPTKPGGLIQSNPGALLGPGSSPALVALLGSLDVFAIYGLVLAALGLRKTGKMSAGSAWSIVIGLYLLGVVLKVGRAVAFGGAS